MQGGQGEWYAAWLQWLQLRAVQKYGKDIIPCKLSDRDLKTLELTMIPAQCGVSLAKSEGLMAAMRKATAATATPKSSCSRATSRGKRKTLHFLPSSCAGLSSLILLPFFSSKEPFCPFPIFSSCLPLSLCLSSRLSLLKVWRVSLACRLPLTLSLPSLQPAVTKPQLDCYLKTEMALN